MKQFVYGFCSVIDFTFMWHVVCVEARFTVPIVVNEGSNFVFCSRGVMSRQVGIKVICLPA